MSASGSFTTSLRRLQSSSASRTLRFLLPLCLLYAAHSPARAALLLQATSPQNGASDVSANGPYTLTFNNPVKPESFVQSLPNLPGFSTPTIRLSPAAGTGGVPVKWTITLSENRRIVTLVPSVPLVEGVFYQLYVSHRGDVYPVKQEGTTNTPLEADGATNPVIFTVKDTIAPEILGVSPVDGADGLPVNAKIAFLASEPLDPAAVHLTLNGTEVRPQPDSTGARWALSAVLQPTTQYTLSLTGADYRGNPLPPKTWAFTTGASAEPDHQPPVLSKSDPSDGSVNVPPTMQPVLTFTEPLSPFSLSVSLNRCDTGTTVEGITSVLSPEGSSLDVKPPDLGPLRTCYEVRVEGEDRAGNALPPAGSPGNRLKFTTADLTGPVLTAVTPSQGSIVHPVTGPDLALHFSEDVRTSGSDAPVLKLQYASGAVPPTLDPRDAISVGGGRWRLEGQGWSSPHDLTLRVLPFSEADGVRYLPGDRLFVQLESAADTTGNLLAVGATPNPWSFTVLETRVSELLEIAPVEDALAALHAPVTLRFSLPMDPSRIQFEADGDWSPTATELFQGTKRYAPRRWVSNSTAWSGDRRIATLQHASFEESTQGTKDTHSFRILSAPDAQGKEYALGAGQTALRTWLTGQKPRVSAVEFLAPADPTNDLTPGGLLSAPDDPAHSLWQPLTDDLDLALNSRFRVHFSEPMSSLLPVLPTLSITPPIPSMEWDGETALLTLDEPLSSMERQYSRNSEGTLMLLPSMLTLKLEGGQSTVGDEMEPFTLPLRPLDLHTPAFRVEYRVSSPPQPEEWRPLSGATVAADAPWRVVADEALAAESPVLIAREGNAGPDPSVVGIDVSERGDSDGRTGNTVEVRWMRPLATSAMARPGEDFVEGSVRVEVRDTRTLGGPNGAEQVVNFRVSVPKRPILGDLDGNGVFDAKDVDRAMNLLLQKTPLTPTELLAADLAPLGGDGMFDVTDLNVLFRLLLNGT